jgi:hypothetical protein
MKNARPHPGPLPQERENRATVADVTERVQLFKRTKTMWSEAALADGTPEFARRTNVCSLSPGERVRVRASGQPIYFPDVQRPKNELATKRPKEPKEIFVTFVPLCGH